MVNVFVMQGTPLGELSRLFGTPYVACVLVTVMALGLIMGDLVCCWAWRFLHDDSSPQDRSSMQGSMYELGGSGSECVIARVSVRIQRRLVAGLMLGMTLVALVASYGVTLETIELAAFACVLLFLSLTDIDAYVIPNVCVASALAIRAAYLCVSCVTGAMAWGMAGRYVLDAFVVGVMLLLTVLVADMVLGRASMGGGDLKLFVAATLYYGWAQAMLLVFVACLLGVASSVLLSREKSKGGELGEGDEDGGQSGEERQLGSASPFPFGPSIALACVLTMLCGSRVVGWYFGLML